MTDLTGQESLSIQLLGGFRVVVAGRVVDDSEWRSRKAAALVKLLALTPGHRLHREQAMEALWPQLDPDAAGANLRKALHFARHALDPYAPSSRHPYLIAKEEFLLLGPSDSVLVDVDAFREAASLARRSDDLASCERGISLYTGELLPEDLYEEWPITARQEVASNHFLLLLEAARLHEAEGHLSAAIERLDKALKVEPLNEEVYSGLMRLYALTGKSGQSLRLYREFEETLRREMDIEPSASTRLLFRDIELGQFPPPGSASQAGARQTERKNNLPVQLTSFVGRTRETSEVERLLSKARLLTLTGAGGSGKTRLALEVAGKRVDRYPDGVWLVELAGLADPVLVPQAVASALGVRDQPGRPLRETLAEYLRNRRLLILLDNCEHLIGACAEFADALLSSCPHLQILVTSREPLNIRGETTWLVPSLSLPEIQARPPEKHMPLSDLLEYEAVQLFAERAASASSSFNLQSWDGNAVAQICYRLDGIPLAIELAAARVRMLSAEQIVERLSRSFSLLTGGSRTDLPRHQTLKAAIDWSYELLDAKERTLFNRLSIFAGGFDLESVEEVCADDALSEHEVLDVLSHLVDKSLVTTVAHASGPGGPVRYRVLETLRQYGRERLAERGEADALAERHARYFALLCARAGPLLYAPEQIEWLDRLNTELDDLRVAVEWCRANDPRMGLLLAGSVPRFWDIRGYLTEARGWLENLLQSAPERTVLRAKALYTAGHLAHRQGYNQEGLRLQEESMAIYSELGDQVGIAWTLERIGLARAMLGDEMRGKEDLDKSVALFRRIGYKAGLAWALGTIGMEDRTRGRYARARNALDECDAIAREIGDLHTIAYALNNLGQLARVEMDFEAAEKVLEECLALSYRMNNKPFICWTLECLSTVARMRGDYEAAKIAIRESLEVAREVGILRHLVRCLYSFGVIAVHDHRPENAIRLFAATLALYPRTRESLDVDEIVEWDEALANARSSLSAEEFSRLWAEGERLTWEQATELALRPAPTSAE